MRMHSESETNPVGSCFQPFTTPTSQRLYPTNFTVHTPGISASTPPPSLYTHQATAPSPLYILLPLTHSFSSLPFFKLASATDQSLETELSTRLIRQIITCHQESLRPAKLSNDDTDRLSDERVGV